MRYVLENRRMNRLCPPPDASAPKQNKIYNFNIWDLCVRRSKILEANPTSKLTIRLSHLASRAEVWSIDRNPETASWDKVSREGAGGQPSCFTVLCLLVHERYAFWAHSALPALRTIGEGGLVWASSVW